MTISLNIPLAGLHAAQFRVRTAAVNIANVNTAGRTETAENPGPPFKPPRVARTASPGGGTAARAVAGPSTGISLIREVVELRLAAQAFRLNLAVLKAQADLLGGLVDLKS